MQKYIGGHAAGDEWRKCRLQNTLGDISPRFPKPLEKH